MNSESTAILALVLILVLGFGVFVFLSSNNANNEQASGISNSTSTNETNKNTSAFTNRKNDDLIHVTFPLPDQEISNPLVIEGSARGFWFFEADFPVMLADERGDIIARGIAQAKSDWMTEDFVPFSAKLEYDPGFSKTGELILRNSNPSDLLENSREVRIPVSFAPEMMTVKVFFGNSELNTDFLEYKVFPVERSITKTQSVARAAIEELLKGPTHPEIEKGFYTSINSGVKVQGISITNGIAKVDFNKQLDYQVAGSARVAAIRAEITETLKQFPTIKDVIISIDGRTDDILQP